MDRFCSRNAIIKFVGLEAAPLSQQVALPNDSNVALLSLNIVKKRSPEILVTAFCEFLRKFVDKNDIFVISHDDKLEEVHVMLIGSNTVVLYNYVSHRNAHSPIAGVKAFESIDSKVIIGMCIHQFSSAGRS